MKPLTLILTVPEGGARFKMARMVKLLEQVERTIFQHAGYSDIEKRQLFVEFLVNVESIHEGLSPADEHLHVNWRDAAAYKRLRAIVETAFLLVGGEAYRVCHYVNAVRMNGEYRTAFVAQDEAPAPKPQSMDPPPPPPKPKEEQAVRVKAFTTPPPLPPQVEKAARDLLQAKHLHEQKRQEHVEHELERRSHPDLDKPKR